jgi:hypothetical protein
MPRLAARLWKITATADSTDGLRGGNADRRRLHLRSVQLRTAAPEGGERGKTWRHRAALGVGQIVRQGIAIYQQRPRRSDHRADDARGMGRSVARRFPADLFRNRRARGWSHPAYNRRIYTRNDEILCACRRARPPAAEASMIRHLWRAHLVLAVHYPTPPGSLAIRAFGQPYR